MKRALVLGIVCALGLGVAAFADAPLSGSWDMEICFGLQTGDVVFVTSFDSNIGIAYEVSGWTFSLTMSLDENGMDEIYFDVLGSLGAFTFASYLEFYPFPPAFMTWENGASITLAGVNLYALFALQNINESQTAPIIGAGWTVGGYGAVGDFTIAVESQFGLESTLADAQDGVAALVGGLTVLNNEDCTFTFTALEIDATFPFACFEPMGVYLWFSCDNGFEEICFSLGTQDLGTWFEISNIEICFTVQTKTVDVSFALVLADTVCFIPYISLVGTAPQIDGVSFDAFMIEWSWNGVTFLAGHIFAVGTYGFSGTSLTTAVTAEATGIDEFFAIVAEGDSCCGGLWSASLINYFNSEDNGGSIGIFDWVSTSGNLAFGIASNLSVTASVQFSTAGLDEFCVGFEFTW